jgi:hypothetical protein
LDADLAEPEPFADEVELDGPFVFGDEVEEADDSGSDLPDACCHIAAIQSI